MYYQPTTMQPDASSHPPIPRALTVLEVADILQTTRAGVYELIHSNRLKSIRVGRQFRITAQALNEFLQII